MFLTKLTTRLFGGSFNRLCVALICANALLVSVLIQSGKIGDDTGRRLQVARSLWTDEPPASPQTSKEFLEGRNGIKHSWYGVGQSLILLPIDILASSAMKAVPSLGTFNSKYDNAFTYAAIGYAMSPLLCVLTLLVCFYLVKLFGFNEAIALSASLGLLLLTSVLQYTQNPQENLLILLTVLSGYCFGYKWVLQGKTSDLCFTSLIIGFGLLVRLTVIFDCLAVFLFIFLALRAQVKLDSNQKRKMMLSLIVVGGGILTMYLLIDRSYHYYRFGELTSTYIGILGRQWRVNRPELQLSPAFPFDVSFIEGFWGLMFSLRKSVFLYDPLIIVSAILAIKLKSKIPKEVLYFNASALLLLLVSVTFYSKYHWWDGVTCFGPRFVTVPAQLLSIFALPLMFIGWRYCGRLLRVSCLVIFLHSFAVQSLSVTLPTYVEACQYNNGIGMAYAPLQRAINLSVMFLGSAEDRKYLESGAQIPSGQFILNFTPFYFSRKASGGLASLAPQLWLLGILMEIILFIITTQLVFKKIKASAVASDDGKYGSRSF